MIANRPRVYLAAPLFSPLERERNRSLRDRMMPIVDVYLPQEDGLLIFDLIASGTSPAEAKRKIFENDIAALHRCDILVIVMDGRSIDEGACFELGFAYCLDKVCVGLKTDARTLFYYGDNPMIECALREVFSNEEELLRWLSVSFAKAENRPQGLDNRGEGA